jgi:hypothetical protein
LERGRIGEDVGAIENLENFELIDFELKIGFGVGFVKLKMLKKVLLIPTYKEEVRICYLLIQDEIDVENVCILQCYLRIILQNSEKE